MLCRTVACAVVVCGALGLAPAAARAPSVQARFRFGERVRSDASVIAPDGRGGFLVAGEVGAGEAAETGVARLTAAGRLAPGLNAVVAAGPHDEQVRSVLGRGGNAFVAGCADTPSEGCTGYVAKLRPDGTPDPAFGTAGVAGLDTGVAKRDFQIVDGVLPAAGGKLLVVGEDGRGAFVARLGATGAMDRAFGVKRPFPGHRRFFAEDVTGDGRGGAVILASVVLSGSDAEGDSRVFALGIGRVGRDGRPRTGFGTHGLRLLRNRPLRGLPHYEFGVRVALRHGRLIVVATDPRNRPVVARLDAATGALAGPRWYGPRSGEQTAAAVDRRGRTWVAVSTGHGTLAWHLGATGSPTRPKPVKVSTGDRHEIVRAAIADRSGRALLAVTNSGSSYYSGDIAIARVSP
jgi:hypothetical protein